MQAKLVEAQTSLALKGASVAELLTGEALLDLADRERAAVHPVIEAQLNSVQASLKEKARKVLELLGLASGAPPAAPAPAAPRNGSGGGAEPNLVDVSEPAPHVGATPPPPTPGGRT